MNYEELLDDLYENLPKKKDSGERFEIPLANTFIQGNKTIIRNFDFICQRLRREPRVFAKYLSRELAVPGNVSGKQFVLQSKFSNRVINEKINAYCKAQVLCRECGKPDTHLESQGRNVYALVCEACGARRPVRV
jgi:translation initiation factor 2 subunit 2